MNGFPLQRSRSLQLSPIFSSVKHLASRKSSLPMQPTLSQISRTSEAEGEGAANRDRQRNQQMLQPAGLPASSHIRYSERNPREASPRLYVFLQPKTRLSDRVVSHSPSSPAPNTPNERAPTKEWFTTPWRKDEGPSRSCGRADVYMTLATALRAA